MVNCSVQRGGVVFESAYNKWVATDCFFVDVNTWFERLVTLVYSIFVGHFKTDCVTPRGTLYARKGGIRRLDKDVEMQPMPSKLSKAFQRLFGDVSSKDRPAFDSLVLKMEEYFSKEERPVTKWRIGNKRVWYTEQGIFLRGSRLGKGGYNTVYEGKHLDPSDFKITDVAISFCRPLEPEEEKYMCHLRPDWEKSLIKELSSPRIVASPLDYFASKERTVVVRKKYFSTASLSELKGKLGRELTFEEKVQIALDAAHGVKALHDKNYLHRDIKGANIFIELDTDGKLRAVLADLGLVGRPGDTTTHCGTCGYQPPELEEDRWTKAGDLYSLGIVLIGLFRPKKEPQFYKIRRSTGVEQNVPNTDWLECLPEDNPIRLLLDRLVRGGAVYRGTIDKVISDLEAMQPSR